MAVLCTPEETTISWVPFEELATQIDEAREHLDIPATIGFTVHRTDIMNNLGTNPATFTTIPNASSATEPSPALDVSATSSAEAYAWFRQAAWHLTWNYSSTPGPNLEWIWYNMLGANPWLIDQDELNIEFAIRFEMDADGMTVKHSYLKDKLGPTGEMLTFEDLVGTDAQGNMEAYLMACSGNLFIRTEEETTDSVSCMCKNIWRLVPVAFGSLGELAEAASVANFGGTLDMAILPSRHMTVTSTDVAYGGHSTDATCAKFYSVAPESNCCQSIHVPVCGEALDYDQHIIPAGWADYWQNPPVLTNTFTHDWKGLASCKHHSKADNSGEGIAEADYEDMNGFSVVAEFVGVEDGPSSYQQLIAYERKFTGKITWPIRKIIMDHLYRSMLYGLSYNTCGAKYNYWVNSFAPHVGWISGRYATTGVGNMQDDTMVLNNTIANRNRGSSTANWIISGDITVMDGGSWPNGAAWDYPMIGWTASKDDGTFPTNSGTVRYYTSATNPHVINLATSTYLPEGMAVNSSILRAKISDYSGTTSPQPGCLDIPFICNDPVDEESATDPSGWPEGCKKMPWKEVMCGAENCEDETYPRIYCNTLLTMESMIAHLRAGLHPYAYPSCPDAPLGCVGTPSCLSGKTASTIVGVTKTSPDPLLEFPGTVTLKYFVNAAGSVQEMPCTPHNDYGSFRTYKCSGVLPTVPWISQSHYMFDYSGSALRPPLDPYKMEPWQPGMRYPNSAPDRSFGTTCAAFLIHNEVVVPTGFTGNIPNSASGLYKHADCGHGMFWKLEGINPELVPCLGWGASTSMGSDFSGATAGYVILPLSVVPCGEVTE